MNTDVVLEESPCLLGPIYNSLSFSSNFKSLSSSLKSLFLSSNLKSLTMSLFVSWPALPGLPTLMYSGWFNCMWLLSGYIFTARQTSHMFSYVFWLLFAMWLQTQRPFINFILRLFSDVQQIKLVFFCLHLTFSEIWRSSLFITAVCELRHCVWTLWSPWICFEWVFVIFRPNWEFLHTLVCILFCIWFMLLRVELVNINNYDCVCLFSFCFCLSRFGSSDWLSVVSGYRLLV